MFRKIPGSVKDKAREAAIKVARDVGQELVEIPKQAAKELIGGKPPSGLVSEQKAGTSGRVEIPDSFNSSIAKRLTYLEDELEKLRQEEKQKKIALREEELRREKEREEQKRAKLSDAMAPLLKPKRKVGLPFWDLKKAKGTTETVKSIK